MLHFLVVTRRKVPIYHDWLFRPLLKISLLPRFWSVLWLIEKKNCPFGGPYYHGFGKFMVDGSYLLMAPEN
jgi:hypothetical protein